ncbi:hypothetical protein OG589_11450 [Sphaerisporangium sp. NBC_01403]|uniref:hypothetical protein n=1 Tax=Sphaerisporangium TaxID=321315 RepID=UPI00324BB8E3
MIEVGIHEGTLTVFFAPWTRPFTRTDAVRVPLEAIAEAHHLDRPLTAATGVHSGLLVSGFAKVGTWTSLKGVRRLVAARRGVPGLRIVLKGRVAGYDELILSVRDAGEIRRHLAAVLT